MILNVSGRTDIVAFYTPWFMNRYKEGYLDVRNPFNPKLVSRIFVSDVDMIVFCTKNPLPLLDTIHVFSVPIQLQVTITGYFKDMEPQVPDKGEIIACVQKPIHIICYNICSSTRINNHRFIKLRNKTIVNIKKKVILR